MVDEAVTSGTTSDRPRRRVRRVTLAAVTAGGLALGAAGVAAAASDSLTPSPRTASEPLLAAGGWGPGHGGVDGRGRGVMGGPAMRGEFVVPKSGGGYQTVAMQRGTVTKVSSSSITVKSADGASRTFTVTADTLVNAARDGISTVRVNDSVSVVAIKNGDSATAVRIVDATRLDRSRQRFGVPDRESGTSPSGPSATQSSV